MRRLAFALASLVLLACDKGGPTDPNELDRIVVSADASSLVVGASMQASATALQRDGDPVTSVTFTWRSTNTSVATVTNTGLITAVAPGQTEIQASGGGKTGSLALTVSSDPCTTPLSLAVGEVRSIAGAQAVSCVALAPIAGENEHVFIAANASTANHDVRQIQVSTALGGVAPQVSEAGAVPAALQDVLMARDAAALAEVDRLHARVLADGDRIMRIVPSERRFRPQGEAPGGAALAVAAAAPGDTIALNVTTANSSNLCTTFATIQAELKATGRKAV